MSRPIIFEYLELACYGRTPEDIPAFSRTLLERMERFGLMRNERAAA